MNMITIALILIVVVAAAGIVVSLIWFLRSIKQSNGRVEDQEATITSDREQHIETLLKDFEEKLGQAGDQDEQEKKL